MPTKPTAPCGSWPSPITAQRISAGGVTLGLVAADGDDIYWLESRPSEGGRNVIMRRNPDGGISQLTPSPFNVRTRVHEYGGGAYAVCDGVIYFCNYADQRIYQQTRDAAPQALTPEGAMRYADLQIDATNQRLICVGEAHSQPGREAVNTLVSISLDDKHEIKAITQGKDFYSSPRLSPDGTQLAWLSWNHPDMPWDAAELWLADCATDGSLKNMRRIAGSENESVAQPQWSPNGLLHFVSDKSGWWNIYRLTGSNSEPSFPLDAEFAQPHWQFCMSAYDFMSDNDIICAYNQQGMWQLALIDTRTGVLKNIATPYSDIQYLRAVNGKAVFLGAGPALPPSIVTWQKDEACKTVKSSTELPFDTDYLSAPRTIAFASANGRTAHGFFYSPANANVAVSANELPPLIVISHGGPTSAATSALKLSTQFWTSRGFAVLDVNYAGSTGYGRDYRRSLYGEWGIADVEDCIAGAEYLAQQKLVDGERLIIRGSSAGGYTTLCALTFHQTFKAGASYYGVSDIAALAQDTHKFESRYEARLIGGQGQERYHARSPVHFAENIACPVIFFQGLEDKVVPPNQTERMVNALKQRGLPVAYVPFEGEQHGFRRAENIRRSLEAELYFYSKVFGFTLADEIEPVRIDNL
jgi:dipeptidyl aminopeptidase/acylaminoacyl peptidase